jgi:DnaJ family protein C protein 2
LINTLSDRKKVLKHHPDKKAGTTSSTSNSLYLAGVNQNTNDDAFFKCIQKAHEVLTNAEKRRQFDSVDPVFLEFEENLPTANDLKVYSIA